MMTTVSEQLGAAIEQAAAQYFRLVILAGLPGSGKTTALRAYADKAGGALVNVNLELTKRLLDLTRIQRSRQVERLFRGLASEAPGDVVFLDNLEVLFDTALEVEPLRLLQVSSRNRTIVASWNGGFHDGVLTYAEPGHPEFVQFKQPEGVVVSISADAN